AGLHDMAPMVANRWVIRTVRAPMRAAAAAASQPAWPPPITATSNRIFIDTSEGAVVAEAVGGVKKHRFSKVFHVKHLERPGGARNRPHLPIQKSRKITSRTSSTSTRPVRRPKDWAEIRNSSASKSSRSGSP